MAIFENNKDNLPLYMGTDGHRLHSIEAKVIDNWLDIYKITHEYGKRLPMDDEFYSDFYLHEGSIYLEYWHNSGNKENQLQKEKKLKLYKQYNLNVIFLQGDDIYNLTMIIPAHLRRFGIKTAHEKKIKNK